MQTNAKQRLCATKALQHDWILGLHRSNLSNVSEKNYSDRTIQRVSNFFNIFTNIIFFTYCRFDNNKMLKKSVV